MGRGYEGLSFFFNIKDNLQGKLCSANLAKEEEKKCEFGQ